MRNFGFRVVTIVCLSLIFIQAGHTQEVKTTPLLLPEVKAIKGKALEINQDVKRLLDFIERESGLQFEIKRVPWNRVKWMVEKGEGIAYGISKSPERLNIYHYSLPIQTDKVWAISFGNTKPLIHTIEDLRGRKLTMTRGFSYGLEFELAKGKLFEVEENYNLNAENLLNLAKDPNNFVLWSKRESMNAQQFVAYFHAVEIQSYHIPALAAMRFNVSTKPIFFDTTHFVSGKDCFSVEMEKLDKALQRTSQNGSLAKILYPEH